MGNEKQENAGEQNNNSLNKNVLRNVSLYIDDMRILRNIVNEYIVYSKILRVSLKVPSHLRLYILRRSGTVRTGCLLTFRKVLHRC